jgi:1,6-anhydro-N-acetylmuramate kinase
MASYDREGRVGRTGRVTEFLLEQLGSQPVFMDIDIIPGAWSSRNMSRRQHWKAEPVVEAFTK